MLLIFQICYSNLKLVSRVFTTHFCNIFLYFHLVFLLLFIVYSLMSHALFISWVAVIALQHCVLLIVLAQLECKVFTSKTNNNDDDDAIK